MYIYRPQLCIHIHMHTHTYRIIDIYMYILTAMRLWLWSEAILWIKTLIFKRLFHRLRVLPNLSYVSYAIPLVRLGFLSSELELPFRLLVLYSIGGIICSRAGISSSRAGNSSSRANLSTYIRIEYKSQNSDKCAALTNHLSLLIKRNL